MTGEFNNMIFNALKRSWRQRAPWRTRSFYLLIATPFILLLGAHIGTLTTSPVRFALVLTLLFVFFILLILEAVRDMVYISTRRCQEQAAAFRETLSDQAFLNQFQKPSGGKKED